MSAFHELLKPKKGFFNLVCPSVRLSDWNAPWYTLSQPSKKGQVCYLTSHIWEKFRKSEHFWYFEKLLFRKIKVVILITDSAQKDLHWENSFFDKYTSKKKFLRIKESFINSKIFCLMQRIRFVYIKETFFESTKLSSI